MKAGLNNARANKPPNGSRSPVYIVEGKPER